MNTYRHLVEQINAAGPVASADANGLAGVGDNPPVRKPLRPKRKPDDHFAGHPVFDMDPPEVGNFMKGPRARRELWGARLDMGKEPNTTLRTFSHRNPRKPILIRNRWTKEMTFLKR